MDRNVTVSNESGAAPRSLAALFTNTAQRFADRAALFVAGRYWTYRELDALVEQIGRKLQHAGLTSGGSRIGVLYARAALSYAAVVAIMRMGCVYVPLNPKAPPQRLSKSISDAGLRGLIVDCGDGSCDEQTVQASATGVKWILRARNGGDADLEIQTVHDEPEVPNLSVATNLAYIVYTSGSTADPKGVAVTHDSACSCMEKLERLFQSDETDRFTQFSALSFDYSLVEIFVCWKSGAALYVPDSSEALVPFEFAYRHRITVWFSVPSLAGFIVKLGLLNNRILSSVRLSLFGGEALPYELVNAWRAAAPGGRILNLYGPTEVTIVATYHECSASEANTGVVPIGVPLPGLSAIAVDDNGNGVPEGVVGELWLSGDQLAVGYWRNERATGAAFVWREFGDGRERLWYRTGDLVCLRRGIGAEFRGRVDRQVKLRGLRIELQEIESVLRDIIGCSLVAVLPLRNPAGMCERIVAYCDNLRIDEATVKARCLSRIPAYMVPERVWELSDFPVSPHGKIDYHALTARSHQYGKAAEVTGLRV